MSPSTSVVIHVLNASLVPSTRSPDSPLDIDRNYGNKRVLTDFPLKHDGSKWTGTINKLIVGFDYTITGHAYKCTDCPEVSPVYLSQNYSVTTFAGNGESGSSNGISSASSFNSPINLALDSNNNIFIADFGNKGIRKKLIRQVM